MRDTTHSHHACAVVFGVVRERQIGLICTQPSGEIAKGAAEHEADIATGYGMRAGARRAGPPGEHPPPHGCRHQCRAPTLARSYGLPAGPAIGQQSRWARARPGKCAPGRRERQCSELPANRRDRLSLNSCWLMRAYQPFRRSASDPG